jgi:hypothetical protein
MIDRTGTEIYRFLSTIPLDAHLILNEAWIEDIGGLDAGVFLVRNTPRGKELLEHWIAYEYRSWTNGDNGALNIFYLNETISNYDHHCDELLYDQLYTHERFAAFTVC